MNTNEALTTTVEEAGKVESTENQKKVITTFDWEKIVDCVDQGEIHWENHARGKNWMATVAFSPTEPSGLSRVFWKSGSGSYRRIPEDLKKNDYIEVAAQYYTYSGRCDYSRLYFQVVKILKQKIVVKRVKKPGKRTLKKAA